MKGIIHSIRVAEALVGLAAAFACSHASRAQENVNSPSFIADMKTRAESGDSLSKLYLVNFLSLADTSAPGYDIALAWACSAASDNDSSARLLFGGHVWPRHGRRRRMGIDGAVPWI
jgi:hypothetical protein